ncbi:hypothetical protein [Streptomyces sp. NPDC058255]|uniref:hypothetical protein n=1 Tax=Streptomyces sp. NPDC058255 TaxID=3346407 RepID=UPI0036E54EB3
MLATISRAATRRPLTVILVWLLMLLIGFGLGTGVFGRLVGGGGGGAGGARGGWGGAAEAAG